MTTVNTTALTVRRSTTRTPPRHRNRRERSVSGEEDAEREEGIGVVGRTLRRVGRRNLQ